MLEKKGYEYQTVLNKFISSFDKTINYKILAEELSHIEEQRKKLLCLIPAQLKH